MSLNHEDQLAADSAWVAHHTGGEVTRFQRIGGGGSRTTSMVDVNDMNGDVHPYVFQRSATGPYADTDISSLPREANVYRELSERGFAIPPFAGLTPDKKAMLSHRVAGSDEFHKIADPAQRRAVAGDFITTLAKLHAFDPSELHIDDLPAPRYQNLARSRLQVWLDLFNRFVTRPAPVVRFAFQWMMEHAPENTGPAVICHGDLGPGNFLFEGNRVTALLDWELIHLGDRHDDLGMLAIRGYQMGGMGNFVEDLALYEKTSGMKVDRSVLGWYRVQCILLGLATSLTALDRQQVGRVALPLYLHLVPYFQHMLVSALVEWSKIDVAEPELPAAAVERADDEILATLLEELGDTSRHPASGPNSPGLKELTMHLQARSAYGAAIDEAELDDLQELLGTRPRSVTEGIRALDERLQRNELGGAELLRWSYRHTRRQAVLWPAWRERFALPLVPLE